MQHLNHVFQEPAILRSFPVSLKPRLTSRDTILQGALVEDVGGEGTECRVHPVLDLQTNWANAKHNQPLKERLRETSSGSLLAHDHRAQLAVIANQDELATAQDDGDHAFWLRGLRALVNQHRAELHLGKARVTSTHSSAANHICGLKKKKIPNPQRLLGFTQDSCMYGYVRWWHRMRHTCRRSFSHCFFRVLKRFSSEADNSPVSSFSCCSFTNSGTLQAHGKH